MLKFNTISDIKFSNHFLINLSEFFPLDCKHMII